MSLLPCRPLDITQLIKLCAWPLNCDTASTSSGFLLFLLYLNTGTCAQIFSANLSACHAAVVHNDINMNDNKKKTAKPTQDYQRPWFLNLLLLIVFLSTQCFCLLQIRNKAHTKVNMNLSARTINFWHAWCEVTCYKTAGKCCGSAALCRPLACSRACTGPEMRTRKIRLSYTAPPKPR